MEREQNWKMRKTKEAIHIRLQGAPMNRYQGAFLSGIYDPLFVNLQKIVYLVVAEMSFEKIRCVVFRRKLYC